VAGGIGGSFTRNTNFYGWSGTALPAVAYNNIATSQIAANSGASNFARGFAGGIEGNYDYMSLICKPSSPPSPPPPPVPSCY
jgi:hypothetical protein